jgi:hypothetical protein
MHTYLYTIPYIITKRHQQRHLSSQLTMTTLQRIQIPINLQFFNQNFLSKIIKIHNTYIPRITKGEKQCKMVQKQHKITQKKVHQEIQPCNSATTKN